MYSFFLLSTRHPRPLRPHPLPCPPRTAPHTEHYTCALRGRRDGDIAPYRHYAPSTLARGGSPPSLLAPYRHYAPSTLARGGSPPSLLAPYRHYAPSPPLSRPRQVHLPYGPIAVHLPYGPVAVGRDVPIAPPRHRRGARLGLPHPSPSCCAPPPRRAPLCAPHITPAHYLGGAMETSRPTAITPPRRDPSLMLPRPRTPPLAALPPAVAHRPTISLPFSPDFQYHKENLFPSS